MAKQPRPLVGRTVAITGGARGIGRATAQALLREGMKVSIGDLDLEVAEQTARELGPGAIALPLNVTERESFTRFLDETEAQLGPLDVLINNAGIMPVGRFIDESDLTAARQIDINLGGVILGMKIALDRMIPRRRGHIVNISSQAGKFGAPGGATYSATKHAVVGLTEAIRGELRLMGVPEIDVSYVMPVVVNTELGSGLVKARGVPNLEPGEVADSIVDALRFGIVDVWVPKRTKALNRLTVLMPRPAYEGVARAIKADRVLMGASADARKGYELRAANSRPGLEPSPAVSALPAPTTPDAEPAVAGEDRVS